MPRPQVQLNPASGASTNDSSWLGWLPLLVVPLGVILMGYTWPAWWFMWMLSFSIFISLKWATWWQATNRVPHHIGRSLGYLVAWPGMDAEAFLDSRVGAAEPKPQEWLWAFLKTMMGMVLLWIVARRVPEGQPLIRGWIGLFGLIFLLHFGTFHLISLLWRQLGIAAEPIMSKPILASSLSEFWGKRWNLGFRQLAYDFIFRPVHRSIGMVGASLLVFLVSGLIHDLVISLPARGGYGLPTAYFLIQGLGVTLERSNAGKRMGLQQGVSGRIFLFIVAAGPVFWLFHPPFVERVIVPFMYAIHAL